MVKVYKKGRPEKGLPPGTLVSRIPVSPVSSSITIYSYNQEGCDEKRDVSLDAIPDLVEESGRIHWIIVHAAHDASIVETIGRIFNIHPLVLEDILNPAHPVKLEDWDDYSYFVLKTLFWHDSTPDFSISQVSLIVSKTVVVTFYDEDDRFLKPVISRLIGGKGKMRRSGTDYLAYAIIDSIVDHYFSVIEMLSDQIDELEPAVYKNPSGDLINRIFRLKRETLVIRNSIRPLRDVLSEIIHPDSTIFPEDIDPFFRDVSDHVLHVIETMEIFREMLTQMIESAMTSLSNRMNEVMKTLTIIATIFIPLTFIAGIYGMNFNWMPELQWKWGYPAILLAMTGVFVGMILWFRKQKWF